MMTLATLVDNVCSNRLRLLSLAGDMHATLKLNVERGFIVAINDEAKLNLDQIIARWGDDLKKLEQEIK